jgi:hypothetical protein
MHLMVLGGLASTTGGRMLGFGVVRLRDLHRTNVVCSLP